MYIKYVTWSAEIYYNVRLQKNFATFLQLCVVITGTVALVMRQTLRHSCRNTLGILNSSLNKL